MLDERQAVFRVLPLILFVAVIAVNAAAVIVPLNGYSTGELSDLNPTGFTPAGYVFSIWSLIYIGLLAYGASQIWGSERVKLRGDSVRLALSVNAVANIAWIFAWHYRLVPLSLLIMLVILGTLIVAYVSLRRQGEAGGLQFWLVDAPVSLYFGWITSASILNLAVAFFDQGRYPFGLTMNDWALFSVTTAVAVYVWVGARTRDAIYCAVFVWAAWGIAGGMGGASEPVRVAATAGSLAAMAVITWIGWSALVSRRLLAGDSPATDGQR